MKWRLIISQTRSGAENMALDEAILEAVIDGSAPPTFRLYAWNPPCLSLGYAQPITDVDHEHLQHQGWDLVRRSTGGRAILHTDELTYAVIAKETNPILSGGVLESYRKLSQGLVHGLSLLGLSIEVQPDHPLPENERTNPVCFQVPSAYEITANGKKLIGSAQVRRRGGVLQHGSIPLSGDIARICQVLQFANESTREDSALHLRERAATLADLSGREITWHQAGEALIDGMKTALTIHFETDTPTEAEQTRAEELSRTRFSHPSWTYRL
jgi:lipoate-protein ligase A